MAVQAMNLGKSYGNVRAVDDLSFTMEPGQVTGFLGPNGSGKSTTMRLMLGLDRGDGKTLWDGLPLPAVSNPSQVVGSHLDAKCFHPTRSARNHLRMVAAASGASNARVDEVIDLMGLGGVAKKRPKGFSLGMAQRLGLAAAILAEPHVLLLDEPANGLDPQSIHWMREFLRHYANEGRVVMVSSHLLSEMQLMADHVIVIARGRLVADQSMPEFVARSTRNDVYVRTEDPDALAIALTMEGMNAVREGEGLSVVGADPRRVGEVAFTTGHPIWELTQRQASLEDAFLELTSDQQEYELGAQAHSAIELDPPTGAGPEAATGTAGDGAAADTAQDSSTGDPGEQR